MGKETKRILLQVGLFIATFATTTLAGAEWVYGRYLQSGDYTWNDFLSGMNFSIPLLFILTVHEFGHYFTAMFHRVKTSLPYYIPLPPGGLIPFSIGTLGAIIRLRTRPKNNLESFDIGLAGPLAGFIVALILTVYAFRTLPPPQYVFQFHPAYEEFGLDYGDYVYSAEYLAEAEFIDVELGTNLLFWIFSNTIADPDRVPNTHELMHYPLLLACYLALFVTSLNLLPIGQLDGGHVVYGLFGRRRHGVVATVFFVALIFYAGLGLPYLHMKFPGTIFGMPAIALTMPAYLLFLRACFRGLQLPNRDTWMYALLMFAVHFASVNFFPEITGFHGWLLFGFILGRFIGIGHPGSEIEHPLSPGRVVLGWVTLIVFILCFSPAPIRVNFPI